MALFVFQKIDQKEPLGFFFEKIEKMIYIGNLILRASVFEYFNDITYFKIGWMQFLYTSQGIYIKELR